LDRNGYVQHICAAHFLTGNLNMVKKRLLAYGTGVFQTGGKWFIYNLNTILY
jgi:hypothetical protein